MSDYARVHDFSVKDGLSTGNPLKVIKGSEVDAEFDALVTHVATKIDEPAAPSEGDLLVYTSGVWTATSNALVPSGAITAYGGSAAPTGWLNCNGASISTTTYADLFAVVGYTYGGAGANFNLPDLTGRVVAGLEASATRLTTGGSGINGATRGATGGTETHTLLTAEMPSHTHAAYDDINTDRDIPLGSGARSPGGGGITGATGGGGAHQNVQPTIVLMYIIKE